MPDRSLVTAHTIASECLGFRVRLVNRALSSIYDDALRSCGVRVSQFTMLVVIANHGTVRPADIAAVLHMDNSTTSRNLERMRRQNWIEITGDESDARAHAVRLTPAGEKLIERAIPRWRQAQDRASRALGGEGVAALHAMAERFISA